MYIKDNTQKVYAHSSLNDGFKIRSIGWLGSFLFPWKKGNVEEILDALKYFCKAHFREDASIGLHTCGLCKKISGRGEFFIDIGDIRYVLPQMVIHYISEHNYLPPKYFLKSLQSYWLENKKALLENNPNMICVLEEEERLLI